MVRCYRDTEAWDAYGVPLPLRDLRDVDEQPLPCNVLEARLDDTELHCTCVVHAVN